MVAEALPHQSDELGLDPPPSETAAAVVVEAAVVTSEFSFHLPPVYRTVLRVELTIPFPLICASPPDAALLATPETTSTSAVSPEA
jgi:hypothetical protein